MGGTLLEKKGLNKKAIHQGLEKNNAGSKQKEDQGMESCGGLGQREKKKGLVRIVYGKGRRPKKGEI